MGGIVGAMFAAGYPPEEIARIFGEMKTTDLLAPGQRGALIGGKGIAEQLDKFLPANFSDLAIPLEVTAVDVQEGDLVVVHDGPLLPALQATSALPGIIAPVEYEGRMLVDGGLMNNLPVDLIRTMTRAPVFAVDVAAPRDRKLDLSTRNWLKGVVKDRHAHAQRAPFFELLMKAYDIPSSLVTEMRLAINPPDLLIRPRLDPNLKVEDFDSITEPVEVGFRATEAALARWEPPVARA
jgi:NTE family protein